MRWMGASSPCIDGFFLLMFISLCHGRASLRPTFFHSLVTGTSGSEKNTTKGVDRDSRAGEDADGRHMLRAVELAKRALGRTSPNPCVGCVIVDAAGEVVGEGWHVKAGEAHAEVVALSQAGVRARNGTAFVSLEPCNHFGRTAPCSHALLK